MDCREATFQVPAYVSVNCFERWSTTLLERALDSYEASWQSATQGFKIVTGTPIMTDMCVDWLPTECFFAQWVQSVSLVTNSESDNYGLPFLATAPRVSTDEITEAQKQITLDAHRQVFSTTRTRSPSTQRLLLIRPRTQQSLMAARRRRLQNAWWT